MGSITVHLTTCFTCMDSADFTCIELTTDLLVGSNPNQSNRGSADAQWSKWVFCATDDKSRQHSRSRIGSQVLDCRVSRFVSRDYTVITSQNVPVMMMSHLCQNARLNRFQSDKIAATTMSTSSRTSTSTKTMPTATTTTTGATVSFQRS